MQLKAESKEMVTESGDSAPRELIRRPYVRTAFIVSWFVDGADEFTGEHEISGMTDDQIAELIHFKSAEDLRPDNKVMPREGIVSLGEKFGIPVEPDKYVYTICEFGFYG